MVLNEKKISKLYENVIKNYDEDSDKGYIFEVDVKYCKRFLNFHNNLPFLAKRMKIKKLNKLACNVYDKKNYVVHIKVLKQALGHGSIVQKVHRLN